jgi:S-adenosylmethionine synthetase
VADQISDAVLDELLRQDPDSKVACETLVTTGLVVVSGEINTKGYVAVQRVAREVIERIGYTRAEYMFDSGSCGVISALHEQSEDIRRGVDVDGEEQQGAGDQGMMFGYACRDTEDFMPLPLYLSHILLQELAAIRREGKLMTYLRPDSKSQVTIEYNDDNTPVRIDTIVISTQHDPFDGDEQMRSTITRDVKEVLVPRVKLRLSAEIQKLFSDFQLLVNPTGKFVIGGPHGDTGLTGRKIIVDTYGGKGAHGGGAFSGKDCSKVDRSAAYAARHMAKNMVAAGLADEVLVQVAYAIGVAKPVGLYVNTYGTARVGLSDGDIAKRVEKLFDMRPGIIVRRLGLKNPIFSATSNYGHMGRTPYKAPVTFIENGQEVSREVEFFAWEKLDYVDAIREAFQLS